MLLFVYFVGSVYKNASHYWPLDYISEMKDLVTHKEATVSGTEGVRLNGKGDGFMEMQVGKAAIRLGEYNHKCLLSLANCDNGLTITFWLRLLEAPGGSNTVDLLSLKSNTGFYVIRVALESTSSELKCNFISIIIALLLLFLLHEKFFFVLFGFFLNCTL